MVAFDTEPYVPFLQALAKRKRLQQLVGKFDPSDLVQETLMRAHKSREAFRGNSEAERYSWLRTILTRTFLEWLRRFKAIMPDENAERSIHEALSGTRKPLEAFLYASSLTPSKELMRVECVVALYQALENIRGDQRQAVILCVLEGLSVAETARVMHRTEKSVSGLRARGIVALRKELRRNGWTS